MSDISIDERFRHIFIIGADASLEFDKIFELFQAQPHLVNSVQHFTYRPNISEPDLRLGHGTLLERFVKSFPNLQTLTVPFDRFNGPPHGTAVDWFDHQDSLAYMKSLTSITLESADPRTDDSNAMDRNLTWLLLPRLQKVNLEGIKLQPIFRHLPGSPANCLNMTLPASFGNPLNLICLCNCFPNLRELSIEVPHFPKAEPSRTGWATFLGQYLPRRTGLEKLEVTFKDTAALRRAGEVQFFARLEYLHTLIVSVGWLDFAAGDAGWIGKTVFPRNLRALGVQITHLREMVNLIDLLVTLANMKDRMEDPLPKLEKFLIGINPLSEVWVHLQEGFQGLPALFAMGVRDVETMWMAMEDLRAAGVQVLTHSLIETSSDEEAEQYL